MVIALHTVAEYRAGRPGTLTSVNLDETIKGALGDLGAVTVLESSGRIYELSPFQFCPGSATCTLFADAPDDSVQGDPG